MAKHTGSALVVLLVGLLVSFTSLASHEALPTTPALPVIKECVSAKQYMEFVSAKNPGSVSKSLPPEAVKVFKFNYNNVPPKSDYNITGVILSTHPNSYNMLVGGMINGCVSFSVPISKDKFRKLMAIINYA